MFDMSATYSPEDNKLRLYPVTRLDAETYARVKAAGFKWAPKQELFVAPMWTPQRESLLIDLCGEIGDEDISLVDRAEQRAERFEDYSDNRAADSQRAAAHVKSIADGIPFGQPILVGHHSERHARKHAEQIENGMRKAVQMWQQSEYWTSRAAGALAHAKYKERPDVRARRIKGIEADKRKQERNKADAEKWLAAWNTADLTLDFARRIAGYCHLGVIRRDDGMYWTAYDVLRPEEERYTHCPACTVEQVQEAANRAYPAIIEHCNRWIAHFDNRLAYERAMLAESGGTKTDQTKPEKGGACKCWATDRGRGCWSKIIKVNKVSVTVLDNWGNGGRDFTRTMPFDKLSALMSAAQVEQARAEGRILAENDRTLIISDDSPAKEPQPEESNPKQEAERVTPEDVQAMRESLKAGIQTVSAPQLFPTPPDVAAYMAELLDPQPGERIGELSAGTGNLIKATLAACPDCSMVAVEIAPALVSGLKTSFPQIAVHQADFLQCNGDLGKFDKIILNPPFEKGVDIKHIRHAQTFLNPGGKLVSLCANGPRQQEAFKGEADHWEQLPEGSFKVQGTGVNVALVVFGA